MNALIIDRTPEIIAGEIQALASQFKSLALSYAIEIGRRLCEAKALVDHGQWGIWLEENTEFSARTANRLMQTFTEFGANQVSLFGDSNSPTLANLSYTKALQLLAIPAEEREEFAAEVSAENLSTRELQEAIKERDKALSDVDHLKERLNVETEISVKASQEADRLRDELKELKSRPVDVAVMEADPAEIEAAKAEAAAEARKQAEAALLKKIEKAEKKAEDADKKAADAQKALDTLTKEGDALIAKATAEADKERDQALVRAVEAEKKLAVADPSVAKFSVLFEQTQGMFSQLAHIASKATPDKRTGLIRALRAMLSAASRQVDAAEPIEDADPEENDDDDGDDD